MKTLLLVAVSVVTGGYVFNRFLAPALNIPRADGFGMDDVAHAATVAGTFYALHRFVPGFRGK